MKKIIALLAASASLAAFAPVNVQAFDGHGHGHGSSSNLSFWNNCRSCGTAMYRERVVVGHDRHGHPIFGYRAVSHQCRPVSHHHGHNHGGSMGHFGHR
ncbi:hypothetical protein [Prosthecobacter sp.]|uniref:hypothetical protein n=1 Tax=Prosthecobacter sp. TaxID=1965333 RepID=UPI0037846D14